MTAVTLVGWIASAVGMTVGLPQLIKLIRTRNVGGLSLFAWQATLVANLIWLGHGIRIEQLPHVVTNLAGLATTLPLVLLLARSHRLGRFKALWPPLRSSSASTWRGGRPPSGWPRSCRCSAPSPGRASNWCGPLTSEGCRRCSPSAPSSTSPCGWRSPS